MLKSSVWSVNVFPQQCNTFSAVKLRSINVHSFLCYNCASLDIGLTEKAKGIILFDNQAGTLRVIIFFPCLSKFKKIKLHNALMLLYILTFDALQRQLCTK